MEVTPLVVMPPHSIPSGRNPSVVSHGHLPFGLHSPYPMYSFDSRSKSPYIHPSLFHHQDEAKLQQQQLLQQQRIFFSALSLASLFNKATVAYTTFRTGKSYENGLIMILKWFNDSSIRQKRKPRWNLELEVLSSWVARQVPSLSAFVTLKLLYR